MNTPAMPVLEDTPSCPTPPPATFRRWAKSKDFTLKLFTALDPNAPRDALVLLTADADHSIAVAASQTLAAFPPQ